MEGITVAPVSFRGKILIPDGSRLLESVESVKRFGLGLKQITAEIKFQFHELWLPNGDTMPIQVELIEVETAKERVDVSGAARGIHPAVSVSTSVSLFTTPLLFVALTIGAPVWLAKSLIAPAANPEIYFPPGTELILQLTAPIEVRSRTERPAGITSFSPEVLGEIQRLLNGSAQRAHGRPSVGPREPAISCQP